MGSSTVSKVWKYTPIGVTSYRPKVGRGNGGSYGFTWWFGQQKYAGYGSYTIDTILRVLDEASAYFSGDLRRVSARHKHVLAMIGSPKSFAECNVLYIRDRDDNPSRRNLYHVFLKAPEDLVIFNLMLERVLGRTVAYHDRDEKEYSFFLGYYSG